MVQETITNRDVELLDDIVRLADVDEHPPGTETLIALLGQISHLVPVDWVALHLRQVRTLRLEYCAGIEWGVPVVATAAEVAGPDPGQEVLRQWYWRGPWSLPERRNRPMTFSTSQVYSQRQWRAHPVHLAYMTEETDSIATAYHTGSGRTVRLRGTRTSGTFTDREVLMLELLRPHLAPFMLATVRSAVAGRGQMDGFSSLTPRQIEILHLVQSGLSNRQIARSLGVNEASVRKHLENVNGRLGVQSRTAAVGAAFGWGDGQPDPRRPASYRPTGAPAPARTAPAR